MARRLDTCPVRDDAYLIVLDWLDSETLTLGFCGLIGLALAVAWRHLQRERKHLAALNSYILMKYRLGTQPELKSVPKAVVEDIVKVEKAPDAARRQMSLEGLWKRAARLESSVDFWVDLLQKLGLLGTVLGLGLALALSPEPAGGDLLAPLSMAVWTTVIGLVGSILISWRFGRDVDVEVDVHEEHLKEWQAALGTGSGE